ncbi:hypothetical protein [Chryseobacterium indoltheticum]
MLQQDFHVTALVRDLSKFTELKHPNLHLIQGNLLDDISPIFQI